jgi:tripartite-type tricarboxylate transporter receptor subunit TctC
MTARAWLLAAAIAVGLVPRASAEYPERTVKIIVPTAPGGSIDTTARVVANKLSEYWGRPVIVENRPGAAMITGADAAAKSPADGYTLLVAHDGTMAMNPVVYPNLPYNPQRDFVPLALMTAIPEVIMVNESVPATSLPELIALAKQSPGKLDHASGGTATLLALELLKAMAGVDIKSIPYRGGAPAVTGVIAGEVQVCIADIATAHAGIASSHVKVLAVTSAQRAKTLPEIPTAAESGVPGYDVSTWIGAFAPAGTPKQIAAKIEADIGRALAEPDVRRRLETLGMAIRSGTGEEMRKLLAADIDKWSRLVKEKDIKIAQ